MEKFAQFGLDPLLLLAQVINFLVLLYLLKRFLYKPILEMLKKREEKIKEGLKAAEKGEEILVKAKEEEKEILGKADKESNLLIEESRQRGAKVEDEFISKARGEAEVILSQAREKIEQEQKTLEGELEKKVTYAAVDVLERILPKVLTRQDQIRIIQSSQKMLRKVLPT